MTEKHRLSAIMFTDIVGYTRKMGSDEARMLRLLDEHCGMVESAAESHEGAIIKRIGDAFLVNFDSALNAVRCAAQIQTAHADFNRDKAESDQVHVRIGIHIGDIVIRDTDVFGDGVNLASRVEPLALPDGICVTKTVFDIVRRKADIQGVSLGRRKLKNVADPVEIIHLVTEGIDAKQIQARRRLERRRLLKIHPYILGSVILLVLAATLWREFREEPAGVEEVVRLMSQAGVPVNPVAALPLKNFGGREGDQYICEGIAEDLIFRLSRAKELYVHPLEDILALRESSRTTMELAKALGVKFLLKGNLQRTSDSLIVQIELIEAVAAQRIFSNIYSAPERDRQRLQFQIASDVLYQILGRASGEAQAALAAHSSANQIADDFYLQARQAQRRVVSSEDQQKMIELYEMAVAADTNFTLAHARLAEGYAATFGEFSPDTSWVVKAGREARKAVRLDPALPEAHYALGMAETKALHYDAAEAAYLKAIQLRPDYREPRMAMAELYWIQGRVPECFTLYGQSLALARSFRDRRDELWVLHNISWRRVWMTEYDTGSILQKEALTIALEIGDRKGETWCRYNGATIDLRLGRYEPSLIELDSVIALARQIGDRVIESGAFNVVGVIREYQGRFKEAEACYQESRELIHGLRNRYWEASSVNNLGNIALYLGDPARANEFHQLGLQYATEINDRLNELYVLRFVALDRLAMGDFYGAGELFRRAINLAYMTDYPPGKVFILIPYSAWLYHNGDIEHARDTLTTIIGKEGYEQGDRFEAAIYLGACEARQGEVERGLKRIHTALDSLDIIPTYRVKVDGYYVLAQLLIDLGRTEEAETYYLQGRTMADTAGMKPWSVKFKRLGVRFQ